MTSNICASVYIDGGDSNVAELYAQAVTHLQALCTTYLAEIRRRWQEGRDLLALIGAETGAGMTVYLAQCSRIMEIAALVYFTASDAEEQLGVAGFLEEFVQVEVGCRHPLSDRYAIGIVYATLILCDRQRYALSRMLLAEATTWLCDRYERGMGLANIDADEVAETNTLLGYPFESVPIARATGSFLAAALGDLAAFLGDPVLYSAIINDIKACGIYPEYWQPQDTVGVCRIEGEDVIEYPNIRYEDTLTDFREYRFAEHIGHEQGSFRVAEALGINSLVLLSIFLRDRYFPKAWPHLVGSHPKPAGAAGRPQACWPSAL